MRVIIAGAGIVGLTAGIAFRSLGWDVLVCEQSPGIRTAGAAIGLWPNALDVFDDFGVGTPIREIGMPVETWFYDASGRRLRSPGFDAVDHEFQLFPRPELNRRLAQALSTDHLRAGAKLQSFVEHADHIEARFSDGNCEAADLLIGADGVYSAVRAQLVPGYNAREHSGHHVWRGMVAAADETAESTVLTIGRERARGGFTRTYGEQIVWMVNQFDSAEPTGSRRDEALKRAALLNDNGWQDALVRLIERTPEDQISHNRIMTVPALPSWTSSRVVLIGDAAHGLSPHISAGGTLGIEDVRVLANAIQRHETLAAALKTYEANRMPHYIRVHELARAVENARDASAYAHEYASFTHWMLGEGYHHSRA